MIQFCAMLKYYFKYPSRLVSSHGDGSGAQPDPDTWNLTPETCFYAVEYAASCFFTAAWAAARRAMGTRYGEQLT